MQIRIVGSSNMSQVKAEFAALQAQVQSLNAAMVASTKIPGGVNPKGYENLSRALNDGSKAYRNSLASTGRFHVEQLKINSATETYTDLLQKQKLGIRDLVRNQKIMKAAYREQLAIQQMVVRRTPSGIGDGRSVYDIAVPTMVSKELDTMNKRIGWYRAQIASAATQTVNWGKNTQWAGRQLMVGFTMPVAALGAATGVMAYQVDKEMTRVEKVYDTAAQNINGSVSEVQAVERELAQLRRDSFNLAANAANSYGAAIQDTLAIEGELAATGLRGGELMKQTNEVMRVATLGEMEYADALQASITTQSVFKMSANETADAFNYMNAVENATSLQLIDFAKALPIAAAPVQQFGGDIKELGILLTAMKQNGIAATQGANAIKASMQRLLRPSAQVRAEFAELTGQDITELVTQSDSLIEIFQKLGKATESLSGQEEGKVFAGLFGSYQVTRMRAMVEGMRDLEKGVGQVSDAARTAQMSTIELAENANDELNRWQRSASGRFKRAVELMKIELAEMGQPFLDVGSRVVEFIAGVAKAFNNLPKVMKNGLATAAIIMAIVGPVVMLTGLFANFAGNIAKFGTVLLGLVGRFNIMNKSQQAATLSAKLAEGGLLSEASAVQLLTEEVKLLTLAQHEAAKAQKLRMMQAAGATEAEMASVRNQAAPMSAATRAAQATSVSSASEATAKAGRGMRTMAISGGIFAAAMTASAISSNEIVDGAAKYAMLVAGLLPVVTSISAAMKSMTLAKLATEIKFNVHFGLLLAQEAAMGLVSRMRLFVKSLRGAGMVGGIKMLGGGIASAGKGLIAMINPAAAIAAAIAAAGFGMYKLWQNSKKAADEVRKTYGDAKGLADIYGYVASEMNQVIDVEGNLVESTADRINKFGDAYGGLVDRIKAVSGEQNKFNVAMTAGVNVINSGGTADQAKLAVFDALAAATDIATAKKITMRFEAQMDFSNAEVVANAGIQKALSAAEEALAEWDNRGKGEKVWNFLTESFTSGDMVGKVSNAAVAAANESGKAFAAAFGQAAEIGNEDIMAETLNTVQSRIEDYNKRIAQAQKDNDTDRVKALKTLRDEMTRTFATNMGVENAEDLVGELGKAVHVADLLGMYFASITNEQRVMLLESKKNLSFGQSLALMGSRIGAGIENAKDKVKDLGDELSDAEKAALRADARMKGMIATFKEIDFKGALQGAFASTQDDIAGMKSDSFNRDMDNALDSLRSRWDRRQEENDALEEKENERFENRWERRTEAVKNYFDNRDKALQNSIDREKKAEEIRQKIFDAEMKRISRLNETANRNIDFNVALNTGDLDEAAKIRNDAAAQEAEWALGDSSENAKDKSARVIERLERRKDAIKEAKDDRLQALDDREEAERKHLTKVQKLRSDALKKEADRDIKSQEKLWASRRKNMDEAIRYFNSYVATNEKDLARHIARTEKKYGEFGGTMKKSANGWSKVIGERLYVHVDEARNKMQSDIKWEAMGRKTANKMLAGALGMNWKKFRKWMISGEWPRDVSRKNMREHNPEYSNTPGRHEGGWINDSKGSRKGYARTSPLHRNEKMILAERGEFMINKHSAAKYAPIIDSINKDTYGRNEGPQVKTNVPQPRTGGAGPGIAGLMGAVLSGVMKSAINTAIITQSADKMAAEAAMAGIYSPGAAGKYGDSLFTAEQLQNAAIIASVGSNMGMSQRDIVIGLMTAMQESNLRNLDYGDRDSVGLFQQRTSMGWGSIAEIMNPTYAATKFFEGLRGIEDRGSMSLTAAAQAVQRSAYPNAYAKWEDEARAILKSMTLVPGVGYVPGTGKGTHPTRGVGSITQGIHGNPPAIDIGTPKSGTGIYAVRSGVIAESRDLRGHEPRAEHGGLGYRSYGRYITLAHDGGGSTLYAHLSQRYVRAGQRVQAGAKIGLSGDTGYSTGHHLHFGAAGASPYSYLSLMKGAENIKFDNTIANLHKGEAVLTKDISAKFREGVDNFASGGNSTYNVNVNVGGSNASADEIANKVITTLKRQEARKPRPRRSP